MYRKQIKQSKYLKEKSSKKRQNKDKKKNKKTRKINRKINQKGGEIYVIDDYKDRFMVEKNKDGDIIIIDTETLNFRKFDKHKLANINFFWIYILDEQTVYKVKNYKYNNLVDINYDKQYNLNKKYQEMNDVNELFLNIDKMMEEGIFFFMMFDNKLVLNNLNKYIESLNEKISKKCKTLKIKFGPYKDMDGQITQFYEIRTKYILLCLYHNNNCISSITLTNGYYGWEISSRTHENYMSRKYNKFLRAIMILICSQISFDSHSIDKITSIPSNPISLWTLKKEYKITYKPENNNKVNNLVRTNNKNEFMKKPMIQDIGVFININDNVQRAQKIFDTLLSNLPRNVPTSIICPDDSYNTKITN
jgi:hypothetical protein